MAARNQRERRIGEFRILRELGRGGMGVVFEAVQESLERHVALKVLPSHISLNRGALERFRREATSASKLNHPAIASVFAVGHDQDLHYFAMELVDGPSLEKTILAVKERNPAQITESLLEAAGFERGTWLPPSPQPPFFAASAAWMAEIADALTSAHNARILHRDLKPSNIIIRADGSPVLVDFGLSQDSMEQGLTRTGDAVGTPAYMSPEQATGAKDPDERVDVYGIGATLYELVTLRPPFTGSNAPAIMQKILDEDVVDPCKVNRACPRELATIILTCLAKDREARYRSTRELAEDLRNFLRGEAIRAKAPGATSRLRSGLQKRRKTLVASAVTAVGLFSIAAGVVVFKKGMTVKSGESELQTAISALAVGDEDEALVAFTRARDALGDERVQKPWLDAIGTVVERRFAEGKDDQVDSMLGQLASYYAASERVKRWRDRAKGGGALRVTLDPPDARLTVRRFGSGTEPGEPVPFSAGRLSTGRYLFGLDAGADYEVSECLVEIEKGTNLDLRLVTVPKALRPKGSVFVAGNPSEFVPPFFIDRCEVTNRQYLEFLETLTADERAWHTPRESWRDGRPAADAMDEPVRSIRVSSAESFARWRGGHLPSAAEFEAAGNLGGSWAYPWGEEFDADRVVSGALRLAHPKAIGDRVPGASRNGALDLVGNVSEWVLGGDGTWLAAGGSYESGANDLRLDRLIARSAEDGHRDVGFRVAYGVATRVYDRKGSGYQRSWERRLENGTFQTRTVVEYRESARPTVSLRLAGSVLNMTGVSQGLQLQFAGGRGFFTAGQWTRVGTTALALSQLSAGVDTRRYVADFADVVRENKGSFDLTLATEALPRSLVTPIGGGRFVHRYPLIRRPGVVSQHQIVLPGTSSVLRVSHEQYESELRDGKRVLTFEFDTPAGRGAAIEPIEVEYVMDTRGRPLPDPRELEKRATTFFEAWNDAQALDVETGDDRLRAIQHAKFCYGPNALKAAELRKALRKIRGKRASSEKFEVEDAEKALLTFRKPRLTRMSAVGDLVASEVELEVSGSDRRERLEMRWIADVSAEGTRDWLLYDVRPPSRMDGCRRSKTAYVHESLGIEVQIPTGFAFRRLVQHPTRLQLRFDLLDPAVLESVAAGREQQIGLSILVLADELQSGERLEDFYERVTRHVWPLWSRHAWGQDGASLDAAKLAGGYEGERRQYLLSRTWETNGVMLQQQVRARSGSTAALIVAVVRCNGPDASLFQEAWQSKLGPLFDGFLAGFAFKRR